MGKNANFLAKLLHGYCLSEDNSHGPVGVPLFQHLADNISSESVVENSRKWVFIAFLSAGLGNFPAIISTTRACLLISNI